ncbi:MAG: hypothetical protein HYX27_23475 [Acidobacteria bacterium]|nr:hypothetical protein [Acidobacteriota bacterium]
MRILIGFLAVVSCLAAEPEPIPLPRHILTNEGLVVLARAGLGDSLLVDLIRGKRTQFDTSADALALLARHGLSENVLRAVVEKQEQVQLRKPRLAVSPVTPSGYEAKATIELEQGEAVLVPPPSTGRRNKSDPDRWYKVSMR